MGKLHCVAEPIWRAIILSGGQSRRMGRAKAFLPYDANRWMIERVAEQALTAVDEVWIVTSEEDKARCEERFQSYPAVHITADRTALAGQGPLAGMLSGMQAAGAAADNCVKQRENLGAQRQVEPGWHLVLSNDLAMLDSGLLSGLKRYVNQPPSAANEPAASQRSAAEAFIPLQGSRMQPLIGAYHSSLAATLEAMLRQGERSFKALVERIPVCFIEEAEWRAWSRAENPFFNMNTPQDYTWWKQQIEQGKG